MSAQLEELLANSKEYRLNRNPEGLKFAEEAYALANQTHNHQMKMAALREKISYALNLHSDFNQAESLAEELIASIDIYQEVERAASAYNVLGICSDIKGDYMGSRNYYLKVIHLLENNPATGNEGKITLGNAFHNLAKLYQQVEAGQERAKYLDKAQQIFEEIKEPGGLARVWNLRASMLPEDAPIEQRLAIFEKGYTYYVEAGDRSGVATCAANIGLCYCHMDDFEKGIKKLQEAVEQIKATANQPQVGFTVFQLAEGYRLMGNYEKSMAALQEAEEILVKAGAKVFLNVVYKEWANNLAAIGRYQEAYEMQQKFIEHVSERLDFDRESAVEEARLKFELEKMGKESDALKKKHEEVELYNQKLQQSNAELNEFAYVASHDLKEPLRMVSNYMQLLERSLRNKLNDDESTYIRYANEGAKRMYKLIDALLAFSRSTLDTEVQLVDLNDVVDEVQRVLGSSANRDIVLNNDELPTILGDKDQMVQLFQNLLANAIKYNDKQEVEVYISYTPGPDAHRISVEDNGIGIPQQHRKKVFEIFKRLHHRETYPGTGIGLSICRKIIHSLNGRIWIENSRLGGASFVFTIPKKSSLA